MNKIKASSKNPFSIPESVSTIQASPEKTPAMNVRILYQGTCPKLTTRGRGDLSYELGIDEAIGDAYVRISANVSSGAFSNEWLGISQIRTLLDIKTEQQKAFSAVVLEGLFVRRSANNHGYLAAILKAESALSVLPGKPVMLSLGSWEPLLNKVKSLKEQGVRLTDHIAIIAKGKAEKKAQLMSTLRSTKPTNPTQESSITSIQDETVNDDQSPFED